MPYLSPSLTPRKKAATSFLQLTASGRTREAYAAFVHDAMRHHNIYFQGDAASLEKAMQENHSAFPNTTLEVKHVLEEGEFVAVHSHVRMGPSEPGVATVHIFRFEGDKIIEMWDIGQLIPGETPNNNGMF